MFLLSCLAALLACPWAIWAKLTVVGELATLAEAHRAHRTDEWFLTRVRVLVLLLILWQTERLGAEATLQVFLRVVFLVVPLQGVFCLKGIVTTIEIAFKNRWLFRSLRGRALLSRASGLCSVSITV